MSTATQERKSKSGSALILQVLVVIAILCLLFALLLPSTQKVRESSLRTQLENSTRGYVTTPFQDATLGNDGNGVGVVKQRAGEPAELQYAMPSPASEALKAKFGRHESAGGDQVAVQRKIIYNADVEIVVENFADAEKRIRELVDTHKGYLAKSDVSSSTGASRRGQWTVRIPIDQFNNFLAAVGQLGELQRNKLDTKDVTEEFFDTETRIKNKQVEEKRLVQHLEKSTGKLEDILAVERELSRVRGEIEQMQGRIQLLTNLTSLTTIVVTVQERKGYVPPTAPSFTVSIERTFGRSWENLVAFGSWIVLVAVALVPWLPIVAVVGLVVWLLLRRQRRVQPIPPTATVVEATGS
jgi:hypothetical protein